MFIAHLDQGMRTNPNGAWSPVLGVYPHIEVWFTCPNGHLGKLDHEIADDGTVSPSVACPVEGCGFHELVKLEDWTPADQLDRRYFRSTDS